MSFSGRVDRESHEGGLLISFEGRPPRLGARIRVRGGKILGKVETVIGPIDSPLIHVHPLYEGIDVRACVGSPVEIAPRENSRKSRPIRKYGRGNRNNKNAGGKSGGRGRQGPRDRKGGGISGRGSTHYRKVSKGKQRTSGKSGRRSQSHNRRRGPSRDGRGKRR